MIKFNFNRSGKFLSFLIVLFISGCAEEAPKSFAFNDLYPERQYRPTAPAKKHYKRSGWSKQSKTLQKKNFDDKDLIWDRLISLYALPEVDHPRVERELNWYLDHPDYLARVQQRAEPYLYQIINEIEEQHIPGEMALLPIVESAFRPDAVSSASAAGLWQFMPATGQLFGLEQNSYYDGRRDVYKSTQAAASYLKDLSETFNGDWLLALASYNYGKGNVQKAIDRNYLSGEGTDYWSLRHLPQETMQYVPKLLAIAKLFAHADEYNIRLHPIRNKAVFEVVDVESPLNLYQAAEMANINTDHFFKLNPGYKTGIIPPDGPSHLLIPVAQVDAFKKKLERIPEEQREELAQKIRDDEARIIAAKRAAEAEKIRRAEEERLAQIKAHQEKLAQQERLAQLERDRLAQIKAEKLAHSKLKGRKGEELLAQRKLDDKKSSSKKAGDSSDNLYTVKKSDTIYKIARAFSVNPKDLAAWNNLALNKPLLSGQKINIKSKPQLVASNTNSNPFQKVVYVVKKGDSLGGIAKRFNVSVPEIRKWNADKMDKDLKTGVKLKVVVDTSHPTT